MDSTTEAFVAHRNLLFTVAYEMLGSAADAEDVLQETWLRWAGVDLGNVRDQRAYLVRITTRQALSRLRTLARRKESYVGPWLPEPLLTTVANERSMVIGALRSPVLPWDGPGLARVRGAGFLFHRDVPRQARSYGPSAGVYALRPTGGELEQVTGRVHVPVLTVSALFAAEHALGQAMAQGPGKVVAMGPAALAAGAVA